MLYQNPHELIHTELPPSIRAGFVPIISRSYQLTRQLIKEHDFLKWEVGNDIIPIIRRVVIEHQFKKMIDTGILSLKYRVAPNKIDNCCHIELITKHNGIITISQVRHWKDMPRKACFRDNLSGNNYIQMSIFEDYVKQREREIIAQTKKEEHYILLTHGYNKDLPDFVYIGMPEPNIKSWVKNTRINLLAEPSIVFDFNEKEEKEELLVEINNEFKKEKEGEV